jgi:hypothetical protein
VGGGAKLLEAAFALLDA